MPFRYFILHKPFGYLSQFTREGKFRPLGDLYSFPQDVYSVGRLDAESEGLLILTNDPSINQRLLHPRNQHNRTYWAQVEGALTDQAIKELEGPLQLKIKGKVYRTLPAKAQKIDPSVSERNPPIRYRKNIPTNWLQLELVEGKNRQVRKMTAAVGFPTLRLIRVAIENLSLAGLDPGEVRELEKETLLTALKLE